MYVMCEGECISLSCLLVIDALGLCVLQIVAEEIKDNRAVVMEVEARNLDKKVRSCFV